VFVTKLTPVQVVLGVAKLRLQDVIGVEKLGAHCSDILKQRPFNIKARGEKTGCSPPAPPISRKKPLDSRPEPTIE